MRRSPAEGIIRPSQDCCLFVRIVCLHWLCAFIKLGVNIGNSFQLGQRVKHIYLLKTQACLLVVSVESMKTQRKVDFLGSRVYYQTTWLM